MSNDNTTNVTVTLPILPILALLFTTLKLCNVITWSWWAVLSPLWVPIVASIGFVGVVALLVIITSLV